MDFCSARARQLGMTRTKGGFVPFWHDRTSCGKTFREGKKQIPHGLKPVRNGKKKRLRADTARLEVPLQSSSFDKLQYTAIPASSPYGNFQGSAVSGRLVQIHLDFQF